MRAVFVPVLVMAAAAFVTMATGMALSRGKRQNYDALLQNKAFVESQINCVLGRGQCDRIGHRIKYLVPEVVRTKECKSCTDEERGNVQKVADHVKNNYPKEWNEIKDQYTDEQGSGKSEEEVEVVEEEEEDERHPRQHQQNVEEELDEEETGSQEVREHERQEVHQESRPENGANSLSNGSPEDVSDIETSTPN